MMKTYFFGTCWMVILAVLNFSCASLKQPDFKGIDNVRIGRFGLNESTLTLDLHYFNPNKTSLKLKEAEGDAWIDGNLMGHFRVDTLVTIPANDNFSLPIKLKVGMKKVFQNSLAAFLAREVMIRIEGKAKLGKGGIYIHYPISYEGKQNLDKILSPNDLKLKEPLH